MLAYAFHDCTRGKSANGSFFDKVISWRCSSPLVHVELAIDAATDPTKTLCFSSVPGRGCRFDHIDLTTPEWVLVWLPGMDQGRAVADAHKLLGQKYDWLGIVGGFTWPEAVGWHSDRDKFCSEACTWIAQQQGYFPALKPWETSPAELYRNALDNFRQP